MNLAAHPGPPLSSLTVVESAPPLPRCEICPLLAENLQLRQQAGYWKSMHHRATTRLTELQAELEHVRAQLRLRERQLFGKKAEPAPAHPPDQATLLPSPEPPRRRGQQRGWPSPPRRDSSHLPVVLHELELPADQQQCPQCGQPFDSFPGTADSELLEIEVRRLPPSLSPSPLSSHLPLRLSARHRHRTRSRQAPPEKSAGGLRLGDRVAGQVCLRPAHAAAPR